MRRNHIFTWEGQPEQVVYAEQLPGYGAGMGEEPPLARVVCRSGLVLQAEPWSSPAQQVRTSFPRLPESSESVTLSPAEVAFVRSIFQHWRDGFDQGSEIVDPDPDTYFPAVFEQLMTDYDIGLAAERRAFSVKVGLQEA
jgi:hypothetical protein